MQKLSTWNLETAMSSSNKTKKAVSIEYKINEQNCGEVKLTFLYSCDSTYHMYVKDTNVRTAEYLMLQNTAVRERIVISARTLLPRHLLNLNIFFCYLYFNANFIYTE